MINGKMSEVSDSAAEIIDFLRRDAAEAEEMAAEDQADLAELEALEAEEAAEEYGEEERTDSVDWKDVAETAMARNAVLEALRFDGDDDDEDELSDEELEEMLVAAVDERVDSLLDAYEGAKGFLPGDYSLRGKNAHAVRCDALKYSAPRLDSEDSPVNWDSEDAVQAAFDAVKLYQQPRSDSGDSQLARVFSRQLAPARQRQDMFDMPAQKTGKRRKRKADYSVN